MLLTPEGTSPGLRIEGETGIDADIRPLFPRPRRGSRSTAEKPILRANGIVKVLGTGAGELQVLKGIDIELRAGELTLLMGPSGSGKTTLLSILGCILTPTRGVLEIAGQSTEGLEPEGLANLRRRHVGFVFQSYNLFPTLTATQNLLLALDLKGITGPEAEKFAERALAEVGLTHRAKSYPGQLSGGEKQRVAIARALAGAPSVVLADEPTAALDGENGKGVMALLSEVAKDRSRAVLAVTHDHRTLDYADRIIRIEDGRIVADERRQTKPEDGSIGHEREGDESHGSRFRRRRRF